ncbi:hypothetical protein JZ751_012273 [Albula glossodonta]|uniref:C2H2-type domain-containing protein n=1 Tax=Albula glossodonta TaxID=121402 RepID=A0A8T2PS49_9TELE|nr:hypothetical protein JZ751_012273 [Albula glossodonta]
MEVLQCDGCDFRAESYDDLKTHIQDVHTAFLQPTAVGDGTPSHSRSNSLNSLSQAEEEDEEDLASLSNEFDSPHEQAGSHSIDSGQFSSSNQMTRNQTVNQTAKPANQFFQCKFCIRYFRSKSLLSEHTKKVHGIVGNASLSERNSPPSQISNFNILMQDGFGKVFSCQYCTYKSPRRARILKHQKMYHKGHLLDSPGSPPEVVTESSSNAHFSEESSSDLPEEVVERSILESMVKPVTKSRGNFSCEWCGYQTLRRERWCDHMMKKHRNMVKIFSSIQEPNEGEGSMVSSKPNSPASPRTPNSNFISSNLSGSEGSSANTSNFKGSSGNTVKSTSGHANKISSYEYTQMKSKVPNSTGSSILSERSTFAMSDMSNSAVDLDADIILNDSGSSSEDDLEDVGDPNNPNSTEDSDKQLLSEEDNKMLETKGIPFRRLIGDKGEAEMLFFCQHCDYGNRTVKGVLIHYQKKHRDVKFPIDKGAKHAVFRCQLCKYFCSTRKGIARHYRIKHNNVRAQPEGKNNVFKCALCSYTNPIRKGLAAHYQKRHDIDAYYTHCLAASKSITDKPNKVLVPVSSQAEGPELSEELRLAVERRKCSLCSFQAFSKKSIVSHYIKRHPGVFPKRQNSSKLGRYFTVVYAKEPENPIDAEEKKLTEDQSEEQENDVERLPFRCLKCFKLSFSTAELLCMHYTDYHSKDLKRDFSTFVSPTQDGMDCYQCAHCDLKFLGLPDLSAHLINHNEEFQKRAMRQERRKQLLSKQKGSEPPESKPEKVDNHAEKTPVGYRCNFCVEVHPTLRAICNHLRKHVQYGEVKAGHVKQEVTEIPVPLPEEGEANGDVADVVAVEPSPMEIMSTVSQTPVAMETAEVEKGTEEVMEMKERLVGGHPCGQCDRVFMSMQGLRSHERSHSAMALFTREDKYNCQYCQFASPFRHNLDRHVQSHHGHHKPFRCKLCSFKSAYLSRLKSHLYKAHAGESTYKCTSCSFSTMTISQLKEHSLKAHGEALTLPKLRAATQALFRPHRTAQGSEQAVIIPEMDEPAYLEPPDVQQQLSHYQLASRNQASSSPPAPPAAEPRMDATLTCEFCEFSSGYMQSLRRHYRDRHGGKKLFKSTFTMHVEAGHVSTPEEGPKDLRCPLCLYHTKYKSNMIDHIVLHREERVVPLEVCRSKLSRHLQGVVFRCHKCTFTCSSDESLQLHIHKHDELKPYQCQLCYYDSKQREDLEAHLRSEHKVIRNFELAGRVNLDQLEAMKDKQSTLSSAEEEDEGEEEEEENDGEEEETEEAEKIDTKDGPGSPSSSVSACSEKRFPCEFCGRSFVHSSEWERHVLRHGMTVTSKRAEAGSSQSIEAAAQSKTCSVVVMVDRGGDFPSNAEEGESGYPSDLAKENVLKEEDREMPVTKNDP